MQIIKSVDNEQLEIISELASEIWNQHFKGIISDKQIDYMLNKFQSYNAIKLQVENEHYNYFLMKDKENEYIGYFAIAVKDKDLFLSKIYIRKEKRGNGYAGKAIKFMKGLAKKKNLRGIFLTVNRNNDNTIKIYEHMNFQITGQVNTDIGNGFFMNDYIMRLEV